MLHGIKALGSQRSVQVFVKTDMTADVTRIDRDEMIDPDTLAGLVRHVIELPNNAAIAELLVNCLQEDML